MAVWVRKLIIVCCACTAPIDFYFEAWQPPSTLYSRTCKIIIPLQQEQQLQSSSFANLCTTGEYTALHSRACKTIPLQQEQQLQSSLASLHTMRAPGEYSSPGALAKKIDFSSHFTELWHKTRYRNRSRYLSVGFALFSLSVLLLVALYTLQKGLRFLGTATLRAAAATRIYQLTHADMIYEHQAAIDADKPIQARLILIRGYASIVTAYIHSGLANLIPPGRCRGG